ncbi:hypothetical protein NZD89_23615 [Alicyclobacillus fastidiosus]|uniref:Uncharacterized protein n=1 Tax=Alicyclobacillus fastidiosus TaxID=392011 RepID=A0ABY6ZGJ8_9BACL|nr:hypothetical protein [Alicyclobacillus fastidiosus]WAH41216.1 hypothetical protein NZD89_23615 [Alicyclobacillus fastidiosus]
MKSFFSGEGQKMPWWTNMPNSSSGIFPEGVPDWVKQFMVYPLGNRDGEKGDGSQFPPMFQDLRKMSSQWPFTALGFDPFWMFHDSAQQATNKKAGPGRKPRRRLRA